MGRARRGVLAGGAGSPGCAQCREHISCRECGSPGGRAQEEPPDAERDEAGVEGGRRGHDRDHAQLRAEAAHVLRVAEAEVEREALAPRHGRVELEAVVDAVPKKKEKTPSEESVKTPFLRECQDAVPKRVSRRRS